MKTLPKEPDRVRLVSNFTITPPLLHIPAIDERLFEAGVDSRQPFPVSRDLMGSSPMGQGAAPEIQCDSATADHFAGRICLQGEAAHNTAVAAAC
jgi:hypothetical protein